MRGNTHIIYYNTYMSHASTKSDESYSDVWKPYLQRRFYYYRKVYIHIAIYYDWRTAGGSGLMVLYIYIYYIVGIGIRFVTKTQSLEITVAAHLYYDTDWASMFVGNVVIYIYKTCMEDQGKKCYFLPFPSYLYAVAIRGRYSNDDALYVDKIRNIPIYYITIIINITIYYTLFNDDTTLLFYTYGCNMKLI